MIFVLRVLHIVAGAFWFGAIVFTWRILIPSVRRAGPAAGPVMAQLNQSRMTQMFMGAAIVNVLAGLGLMWVVSGGDMKSWMQSNMGKTFATGGALAILALIIGIAMNPPAVKRMGAIQAAVAKRGGPPTPEEAAQMEALQARIRKGTAIVAVLLTLTVIAMAVARYT